MQENTGDFSIQDAMRLARSPAGQQLLALLRQSDPEALQNALSQVSAGDLSQAKKALAPLLESQEVKQLIAQMGG